jgi:1,3-beta-glucanosyltransferase GAS1
MLQNYLACGGNSSDTIDFFSLNSYEWCGDSSYNVSGYDQLQEMSQGYPIPIFFSETGCNKPEPRTFEDQSAIFGPEMNGTWSGAIVYEWIQETNDYGLIDYGGDTASGDPATAYVRSGTPTPLLPDFTNLQSQWATLSPSGIPLSEYSASLSLITTPTCPSSTSGGWLVDGNPSLPSLGATINTAAATATGTPSAVSTAASPTSTKGTASGGNEIAGMCIGLAAVMLGFVVWL